MCDKFDMESKMRNLDKNYAIQGETVGPKINGNKLKLKDFDFRVFNIYDIDNRRYLSWDKVVEITDELGLNRVPELFRGIYTDEMATVQYLLKFAEELEYAPKVPAEGIVIKNNGHLKRRSFKAISNKFLLKNG